MDDLLAGYEDELGIDSAQADKMESETSATIAQEVNLLKQASESQMEVAMKKEQSLSHGDGIDQYMPTENVLATMQSIDDQRLLEIRQLQKNDPNYDKKVKEVTARAKHTKYKAMKNLNVENEKIPSKVKANMVRRGSI